MRRQTAAGESLPAGSGRERRLDPHSLPVRFAAADASADGRARIVEIDRDRVLLHRTVRGVRMRLYLPLVTFLGVAVRLPQEAEAGIAIVLEHPDSSLSVPLQFAAEPDRIVADWQSWGRTLRRPLLVADSDGTLREPFPRIGELLRGAAVQRRVRKSLLRRRRLKLFRRRAHRPLRSEPAVHRGEREIIARD